MIYENEATLIAPDAGVAGSLIIVPREEGSSWYGIVASIAEARLGIMRLRDMSLRMFNSFAVKPFLQLGPAVIRYDAASSTPLNKEFNAGSYVMTPTMAGIYLPGQLMGVGSLFKLDGETVSHEQGVREVSFTKYEIGFMRDAGFKAVHRVGFDE